MQLFKKRDRARIIRQQKEGLPPGTLITDDSVKIPMRVTVAEYCPDYLTVKEKAKYENIFSPISDRGIKWIHVSGTPDVDFLKKLGEHFSLHPMLLEDITETDQRPKYEEYDDCIYLLLRALTYSHITGVTSPQVSIVIGSNYVLSFFEDEENEEHELFSRVYERLDVADSRIRTKETDYLGYVLMDTIVDSYFSVLEEIGEKFEVMQEALLVKKPAELPKQLFALRDDVFIFRKAIWPLREVVSNLEKAESHLIYKGLHVFLRDLYDHTYQIMDTVETYRDMIRGLHDMHMNIVNTRMNEVMKVLTIIATIFIPLSFIAGVYGMNFEYMPELKWPYGYFMVLGLMTIVVCIMLLYFRRKNWI